MVSNWGQFFSVPNWPPSVIEQENGTVNIFDFYENIVRWSQLQNDAYASDKMVEQEQANIWRFDGPVSAIAVNGDMSEMVVKVSGFKVC